MDIATLNKPDPATAYRIGGWTFHPSGNELCRNGERRPLEYRAARALEQLCLKRGATVSREALIDAVWEGRSLSDNTVAVVISGLRKALDDDHRNPRFIETVAKRGYRLLADNAAAAHPAAGGETRGGRAPVLIMLAAVLVLAIAAAAIFTMNTAPPATIVTIKAIENKTGDARYDPVAAAVDGFAASALSQASAPILIRDFSDTASWDMSKRIFRQFGAGTRVYHLSGTIVVDGATPFLSLAAADGRDWSTVWTASIPVEGGVVAAPVGEALQGLLAEIERKPAPDAD